VNSFLNRPEVTIVLESVKSEIINFGDSAKALREVLGRSASSATALLIFILSKAKAVPLHAMKALGGRGSIAPTDSRPRH
jgi:hypothetical protein